MNVQDLYTIKTKFCCLGWREHFKSSPATSLCRKGKGALKVYCQFVCSSANINAIIFTVIL